MWFNLFMGVLSKKVQKSFWLSGCNVVSWLSASSESAGFFWCWAKSACKPGVTVSPLAVAVGSWNLLMEKNWELLDLSGSFVSSGFILRVHQEPQGCWVCRVETLLSFCVTDQSCHKCQSWFCVCSVNLAKMSHEMFSNVCNGIETDASNVPLWLICIRNRFGNSWLKFSVDLQEQCFLVSRREESSLKNLKFFGTAHLLFKPF